MNTTTRAEILFLWRLAALREQKGAEWCERKGIGPMRIAAGSSVIVPIEAAHSPHVRAILKVERETADLLRDVCRKCGGCRFAKV